MQTKQFTAAPKAVAARTHTQAPPTPAAARATQMLQDPPLVNLTNERYDASALGLLTAKDAWDNLVLPLRIESGQLVCATTEETLTSAVELVSSHVAMSCRFVLAEIRPLEQFIAERYHYEGVEL